jgi:hypothetical protein
MISRRGIVQISKAARKDIETRLRGHREATLRALSRLRDDPYLGHPLGGRLKGARALEFSLKGIGECRAVYLMLESDTPHESIVCLIAIVGPHENIYDRAVSRVEALRSGTDRELRRDDDREP